ncbi:hypothetical protein HO173_001638 [Letharia columbiana]|uniref:Ketoreductase domain-containing protein n=1 Tax=Letharia columbiana TaxID=112416 RepID=A0A8H6L917_9LECA|nr:uncharacterized protein HO173_001638 [Letharia columbiana]KAF6240028.1 hypothetical protein HO173_001638 [Letharia columbiana]
MINLTRRLRHRLPPSLLPTPILNRALSAPITPTPKPKPEVPVARHTEPKPQRRSGAGDVGREAVAFDGGVVPGLTPTMARFTLGGKVAVVTGGARGLGWNMSQALAEAGAQAIALIDVKQDLGDAAAAELHSTAGIPVRFYRVDVRDAKAVADAVAQITSDLGSVDIVINSAGVVDSNIKAETYDAAMFRNLLDVNLTGSFLVSQACARHMITARAGGSIIFLSSIAGSRVLHPQQQCAYNASKAAVAQLAKSLAAEWAPHSIRVNTIAPGYMDTALNREALLEGQKKHWSAMTPMGRLGRPDELNGLAVFLASDASGFVTGAEILADGGYAVY